MISYNSHERETLLATSKKSIANGLISRQEPALEINIFPKNLIVPGASFVTLYLHKRLRGCIGSLLARQPLIVDVANNAYNAAFRDPRFKPVTVDEYTDLELEISILTKPQHIYFKSEQDLISKLRPGIDGLILSDQGHRGTFLPSVWEQLPDPQEFLKHLKLKAGLPTDYWSDTITIENYTTELIS